MFEKKLGLNLRMTCIMLSPHSVASKISVLMTYAEGRQTKTAAKFIAGWVLWSVGSTANMVVDFFNWLAAGLVVTGWSRFP